MAPATVQPALTDNSVVTVVEYGAVLQLFGFLACIWAAGQFSNFLRITPLVGEIIAGSLLGSPVAQWVRYPRCVVLVAPGSVSTPDAPRSVFSSCLPVRSCCWEKSGFSCP